MSKYPNLVKLFFDRATAYDDAPFLWRKSEGKWRSKSWRGVAHEVSALASALQRLGLEHGDRVMLVSENRPEFCVADLAIMAAGGITVPTYITNTEADHAHVLADSGARVVIMSTPKIARTLLPAVLRSGNVQHVIGIERLNIGQSGVVNFHDWGALLAVEHGDPQLMAEAATFERTDIACIIYTSGTGGAPRGVMQTHGAILHNLAGAGEIVQSDFSNTPDVFISFLPLSHAYEHTCGQFFPIWLGAQIYYAESLEKLGANIEEVSPTFVVVVPRLFELIRARILKAVEKQGRTAQSFLQRAIVLGERQQRGQTTLLDKPLDLLLDLTLRRKLRAQFGGRCKALVSGGAPLNPEIGQFFQSLGLTLLQGYGMTEAGPLLACNRPAAGLKMDTVGPPLPGVELKIADDGEILARGENIMQGYWKRPEETAKAIVDGWLHTGDVGHFDEKGRLHITDRKKDIVVNDKGDNISPQKVEGMLTLAPEIFQAMVIGDKRPHLVGLVVPDPDWAKEWAQVHATTLNLPGLCLLPAFHHDIMAAVDRVNTQLSVIEKVRRVALVADPFTVENEMLTPSIKIRRHKINQVYAAELSALYG